MRVDQLCAPVAVNHGYVANPEAQLTCYALNRTKHSTKSLEPKTSRAKRGKKGKHGKKGKRGKKGKKGKKGKPGKPQPHQLLVTNSFGEDQALALDEAKLLCVPSTQVPADFGSNPNGASDLGIDHYQCYDAKPPPGVARFEPLRVALHDQYGDSDPLIAKPKRVCMPVDKNSEGILDEELLLTCYEIEKRRRREGHHGMEGDVLVNNQFGDDQAYDVKRPKSVCLPSTAEVVD